jgi:hypothetical protein
LASAQPPSERSVEIVPIVAYQAALTETFAAADMPAFERQADRLRLMANGDDAQLVVQILWFAVQNHEDARMKAFVGRLMERMEGSKEVIVAALAPHLDNREGRIRQIVQTLLTGYEDRSATRPPDFSVYRAIIEADILARRQPQTSLVHFMYRSDPGTALQTMVRACQLRDPDEIKPILWGEHVVAELLWKRRYGFVDRRAMEPVTLQELEKLSRHSLWWVRLYVVEIVRSYPELGTPGVVERLADDADARVRGAVEPVQTEPTAK